MTYDSRKTERGQEFVEELDIYFDGCQYAVDPFGNQNIFLRDGNTLISPGSVNFNITANLTTFNTWFATWSGYNPANLYAYVGQKFNEIVKCEIVDFETLKITGRGQFGTTAGNISANQSFRFIHIGEADGSCRGYSQTCSDPDSYEPNTFRVLNFCNAPKVAGSMILPGLYSKVIDYDSAEVDVGESIGSPAKLKFRLQDFVSGDEITVPYSERRSTNGTFWGRTLARNPYPNGRKVVYKSGLRDAQTFAEPDYIERHFIIDSVNISDGYASFSCLGAIILTEDKKAKMPVVSPAQLSADITGTPTTFSYINAPDYYFGAMASEIYVRIDSEVIKCTVSGATQLTVVTRGYRSEAKDHEVGATVQDCVRFAGTHVIDAITFALENYTSMPASYIADYTAVKALIPTVLLDEAIISKPQSVADFISSMIKFGNLIFYFDEALLEIVIDYIPELSVEPITISENEQILRGSVSVNENSKEQYTRFAHLWAPVDITKDAEENYAISYLAANLDVESAAKMGEINEKKTFKNPLLTNSSGDSLIGTSYTSRVVSGADKSPRIVTSVINAGSVGATQGGELKLGSIVNLVTKENQDIDGLPNAELFQVLKISGNAFSNFTVRMRRYLAVQPEGVDFVISESAVNYVLSNHFAPAAGNYVIYINQGVEFGSYNVAIPAFTTGTQAPGVTFTIILRGSILGMGGEGADFSWTLPYTGNAQNGGIAFEATVNCVIDCGSGLIWAGGGGGGADKSNIIPTTPASRSPARGGSGGQGFGIALGGFYTSGSVFPSDPPNTGREQSGNRTSPGTTGNRGGDWGQNGKQGNDIDIPQNYGLAGEAIKSNGNSVTITLGNNDFNIRGRRT